jgi:hypothetical protein
MAGYIIYSLDWGKFQQFVGRPTPGQLVAFASRLWDGLEDREFDEGDPILGWPTNAKALAPIAAKRLAMPDWYGDLSATGKGLWEGTVFVACMNCEEFDVGFRVDNDGIYFDVIELAWKHLGVVPGKISDVALSAFGYRPYRYQPETKTSKTRKEYEQEEAERRSALTELKGTVDEFVKGAKQIDSDPNKMLEELKQGKSGGIMKALMGFFVDVHEGAGAYHLEDWQPMHSMHTPDEVQKMLLELQSLESQLHKIKKKDVRRQYEEDLLPALNRIADEGRMLFIQVDT